MCSKIMRCVYIVEVYSFSTCESIMIHSWLDFCQETEQEMKPFCMRRGYIWGRTLYALNNGFMKFMQSFSGLKMKRWWSKQGNGMRVLILCIIQSLVSVWKGQWLTLISPVPGSEEMNRCQSHSCNSVSRTAQLWIDAAQCLLYTSPKL